MADAAASLKYVTLELGGKSRSSSLTMRSLITGRRALLGNFYSRRSVSNGTRVFVHRSIKSAFIDA